MPFLCPMPKNVVRCLWFPIGACTYFVMTYVPAQPMVSFALRVPPEEEKGKEPQGEVFPGELAKAAAVPEAAPEAVPEAAPESALVCGVSGHGLSTVHAPPGPLRMSLNCTCVPEGYNYIGI